jgi:hypothetical protein
MSDRRIDLNRSSTKARSLEKLGQVTIERLIDRTRCENQPKTR